MEIILSKKIESKSIKRTNNKFIPVCIALLQNISIFFYDIVHYITAIQCFCLILSVIHILLYYHGKFEVKKNISWWFLYVVIVVLNYLTGGELNFIISFLIFNLLMLFNMGIEGLPYLEYSIAKICAFIHLAINLMVFSLPAGVINPIFSTLLGSSYKSNYSWRIVSGVNAGMTSQIGTNAMYLSVCFFFCFIELIEYRRNKILYTLGLVLSYLMILTTQKRSAAFISIIAIVLYYFIVHFKWDVRISIKKVCAFIVIVVGAILLVRWIIFKTDFAYGIIEKTNELARDGDISNGRFNLIQVALGHFNENPFWGTGLKSIYNETGMDVHNTYIQILAETGLVGELVFFVGFALIIKDCRCILKKYEYQKDDSTINDNNINIMNARNDSKVVGIGFLLIIFLALYGLVGNTFIDYLPTMLFCLGVQICLGRNFE